MTAIAIPSRNRSRSGISPERHTFFLQSLPKITITHFSSTLGTVATSVWHDLVLGAGRFYR